MSVHKEILESDRLLKFTKVLTIKIAQIVVQSRQGKKITPEYNNITANSNITESCEWFNLSIPDEPKVNEDIKQVLRGEVADDLAKNLCIEISLKTSDGDEMVLEIWTVKLLPETSAVSLSAVYSRMSVMLKSALTISRMTPAYKLSRAQEKESYKISYKIYGGSPNINLLGDKIKTIKVSELRTPIGTLLIEVVHRTKMTIMPEKKPNLVEEEPTNNELMVKSDHFKESPKKNLNDKKELDLSKPLSTGAFVGPVEVKELHDTLSNQLPPEPPMTWLLAEKEKIEKKMQGMKEAGESSSQAGSSSEASCSAAPISKAIEVPESKADKCAALMEFPFADGSPIAELANFFKGCIDAKSISDEWTELTFDPVPTDSETLSKQLKMYEDAVPEFDDMVASMYSNTGSSEQS